MAWSEQPMTFWAPTTTHWSESTPDPNAPEVIRDRADILSAAWQPPIADRIAFLRERVAGKTVLDVGCVAHDEERFEADSWLHRHLAQAADRCIGLDLLEEGVATMRAAGYEAIAHDLSTGLGPLFSLAPFDVIVAGEVIEHLGNLDLLFETADLTLAADGELIITTPNPFAPSRVRAGRRGEVWENVDHTTYAFPSGIAELAARHGLMLIEATTTKPTRRVWPGPIRWLKRTIRRSHWHRRGFATTAGHVRAKTLDRLDWFDRAAWALRTRTSSHPHFVGETFVYVVARGPLP